MHSHGDAGIWRDRINFNFIIFYCAFTCRETTDNENVKDSEAIL